MSLFNECNDKKHYFFFAGTATICEFWPSPWFHNRKYIQLGVINPVLNPQPGTPEITYLLTRHLTCLAWVAVLGTDTPTSIAA
jgi:hypothetical protein